GLEWCLRGQARAPRNHHQDQTTMSDHVPVSRPNPFFELLFGGNMLEGTFKAVIWVALLAPVLAWTTFR
ncbi:hypothetical protein, partial [Pseudomonas syringae group genomosp. 7]|uniref:hypothetical protein n=1 Tax=Pseudomonas syringae group genomosp. 7 TaxID=251699 RepID=UPI00376F7CCF